jgi:hypothetical protein
MTRRTPALAVALLLLAPLTGCSDDESGGEEPQAADSATSDAPSSDPSDSPSASEPEPSDTGVNSDASPTGADKAYCDKVASARGEIADTTAGDAGVDGVLRTLDEITRLAPDDIRPQWEVLGSTIGKVQAAVEKAGLDVEDLTDPEAITKLTAKQRTVLTKALQGVDVAALPQASQEIADNVGEVCGIELFPEGVAPTS